MIGTRSAWNDFMHEKGDLGQYRPTRLGLKRSKLTAHNRFLSIIVFIL